MYLGRLILLACHVLIIHGLQRRWVPILDVNDPSNWSGGDVVCANDRKTFPADFVGSVYIQKNESLQELVLSNNMELILSDGASLTFTNNPVARNGQGGIVAGGDNACTPKGRNITFNATTPSYFNPSSWSVDFNKTERLMPFLLDLQGFPCGEDEAIFPADQPYVVDLEDQNVQLQTVTIHGKLMSNQAQLNKYWNSSKSRYEFIKRNNSITVSNTAHCPDRYSIDAPIKNVVCRHRKCDTALSLEGDCIHPVTPTVGQCCSVCGSVLYLSTNESTTPSFDDIFALFPDGEMNERKLRSVDTGPVSIAIGPVRGGMYEILLMSNDSGKSANVFACDLQNRLEKHGVFSTGKVNVTTSDGNNCVYIPPPTKLPIANHPLDEHTLNRIIIGVTVGVGTLIILLAVIGFVYYRRRQTGNGKDQFELGNVTTQGFENPVYDSPLPFDDNFTVQYDPEHDQLQSTMFSPGHDSGVGSVGSPEKKKPLPDTQHPLDDQTATVSEVGSRKSSKKKSKTKSQTATSFENPNYSATPGPAAAGQADGMVSVPLDGNQEVQAQVHQRVEVKRDPSDSIPTSVDDMRGGDNLASAGLDNPLYEATEGGNDTPTDGMVTGFETASAKRDKKSGKKKKRKGAEAEEGSSSYKRFDNGDDGDKGGGFENPLYGQGAAGSDDSTVGDPTRLPPIDKEE